MGIDDLVSQGSWRKVGSLGNVEKFVHVRSLEYSTSNRPQSTENSEERTLSTAIGATDHSTHASINLKRKFRDKHISIRSDDWDLIKYNVVLSFLNYSLFDLRQAIGSLDSFFIDDLTPNKLSLYQIVQDLFHLVD